MTYKTHKKEYVIWLAMKTRCYNENHPSYRRYGALGITVCERWKDDFDEFVTDMGRCPDGFSIDRKDNTLGYFPENCQWADRITQARNRCSNRRSLWRGREALWIEIAIGEDVNYNCLRNRLNDGWSVSAAVGDCQSKGHFYVERAKSRKAA